MAKIEKIQKTNITTKHNIKKTFKTEQCEHHQKTGGDLRCSEVEVGRFCSTCHTRG